MPTGRNRRFKVGSLTVLDETYNASPETVIAALDVLVSQPGRHFAVLGTMMELGEKSLAFQRQIVERVVELELDGLVVVADGMEAEVMEVAASSLPRHEVVSTPELAAKLLQLWLQSGDSVLLKASRAISLERLIPLLPVL